jgi:uncharacterized protein (TIGR03437 family)
MPPVQPRPNYAMRFCMLPMLFAGIIVAQSAGNWSGQIPSTFPSLRYGHAMVYDSAHSQVVLFGGYAGRASNDTWIWDGSNWTQRSPQNSPPARVGHTMAYDSAHGQTVLFGGTDSANAPLRDTWVWDGSNWTQKSPAISPAARSGVAMAYDSAHGQVVLFGGAFASGDFNDTWTWDGSNWTQKSPQNSPPSRLNHFMTYDSAHGQTVLFGGYLLSLGISFANDTWTWDGSNWIQKSPQNSPPARVHHVMAYDSAHSQVVLFGGAVRAGATNDTWTWDGSNWTQKSPQNSPSGRESHAMAYDSAHGQIVLFGGYAGSSSNVLFGDTWTWDGGGAGTIPQVNTGGIVNNASYNLGPDASSVVPGSIAAIFGSNLTDGSSCLPPNCNPTFGSNGKLNTTMAGAQVTVGGTAVPIFYATPTQLGIQIPFEIMGTSAQVMVSVAGRSSTATAASVATVAPGIFTSTADGQGAGAITHVDGSAVTPQSPAQAGELVILYATGLGPVMPAVPTGALPAGTSSTVSQVMVNIGGTGVIPDFAGLAGCCIGLNQINVRVPVGVSRGNAVPVVVSISGKSSNTATIAVQ